MGAISSDSPKLSADPFGAAELSGSVVATIMTAAVTALWTVVFVPTVVGFFKGTLFLAPCLASLPPGYVERLPGSSVAAAGGQL